MTVGVRDPAEPHGTGWAGDALAPPITAVTVYCTPIAGMPWVTDERRPVTPEAITVVPFASVRRMM